MEVWVHNGSTKLWDGTFEIAKIRFSCFLAETSKCICSVFANFPYLVSECREKLRSSIGGEGAKESEGLGCSLAQVVIVILEHLRQSRHHCLHCLLQQIYVRVRVSYGLADFFQRFPSRNSDITSIIEKPLRQQGSELHRFRAVIPKSSDCRPSDTRELIQEHAPKLRKARSLQSFANSGLSSEPLHLLQRNFVYRSREAVLYDIPGTLENCEIYRILYN
mmetsp:Transcript_125703/g.231611  ORF Transcript_125703/g.231611 Transcript_125703/m.231611 type:complete len:220 (+) Transcript_125703:482-1141(+)